MLSLTPKEKLDQEMAFRQELRAANDAIHAVRQAISDFEREIQARQILIDAGKLQLVPLISKLDEIEARFNTWIDEVFPKKTAP